MMELDPAIFTCILTEMGSLYNLELPSDITENLYELYEGSYENYTLFELDRAVFKSGNKLYCPLNKKAIINMIEINGYDVPKKKERSDATTWEHYRIRRSLDVLETPYCKFYEGTIIQLQDGILYYIDVTNDQKLISEDLPTNDPYSWEDIVNISLYPYNGITADYDEEEVIKMTAQEFINMIDFDDVTIVQNTDMGIFLSDEEEEYWTNY
jgi:hypothetical protein